MPDNLESVLGIQTSDAPAAVAPGYDLVEPGLWSAQGRIGRASFWARMIVLTLIGLPVGFVSGFLMGSGEGSAILGGILYVVYMVAVTWFSVVTQIKRWHDMDKSGWFILLNFTIIALPFILIVLGCVRGTAGPNRFGADPVPSPF